MYNILLIGGFGCTPSYCSQFKHILTLANVHLYYISLDYELDTFQQHVLYLKKHIVTLYNKCQTPIYLMGFSTSCTICIEAYKQLKSDYIIKRLFLLNPASLYFHITYHASLKQFNLKHSLPSSTRFVNVDHLNYFNAYPLIRVLYNKLNYFYVVRYCLAYVYYLFYGKYRHEPFDNILYVLSLNANNLRKCLIECIFKQNPVLLLQALNKSYVRQKQWKRNNIIIYSSIDDDYSAISKLIFEQLNNIVLVKRLCGNHHIIHNNPQLLCDKLIHDIKYYDTST
jgi:hypothetical protein